FTNVLLYIMSNKLAFLENSGTSRILTILLKNNRQMYLTELKKKIGPGSMSTLNMRILELKNLGLLDDKLEEKFGGRRYIWLTEKGKKIAEYLLEIEKII
ncbi:MAG: winged helix-turn-helix transcriptional regulator, partial [Candidatus Thermoplasmatota archaeon]|nr:winged helix-turn-helix transcriptional regulator [Candidatus Thermoplasmatota archaeon]